jgi:hypothetical protein
MGAGTWQMRLGYIAQVADLDLTKAVLMNIGMKQKLTGLTWIV